MKYPRCRPHAHRPARRQSARHRRENGTDGVDDTSGVLPAEMWDPETTRGRRWPQCAGRASITRRPSSARRPVLLAGGGGDGNGNNDRVPSTSPRRTSSGARARPRPPPKSAIRPDVHGRNPERQPYHKVTLVMAPSPTTSTGTSVSILSIPTGTGGVSITVPSNPNLAPPGYYMVILLDDQVCRRWARSSSSSRPAIRSLRRPRPASPPRRRPVAPTSAGRPRATTRRSASTASSAPPRLASRPAPPTGSPV